MLKTEGGRSKAFDPQTLAFGEGAKAVLAETLKQAPTDFATDPLGSSKAYFSSLLNHSESPLELRLTALNGLGQLAHGGDEKALNLLADYYPKSTQLEEKRSIRNIGCRGRAGAEPLKALAGAALPEGLGHGSA